MIPEAIPVGTSDLGGFNRAGQVSGERPDELQRLALQVGGWAMGCPIPVTETRHTVQDSRIGQYGREVWRPYEQQSARG